MKIQMRTEASNWTCHARLIHSSLVDTKSDNRKPRDAGLDSRRSPRQVAPESTKFHHRSGPLWSNQNSGPLSHMGQT